MMVDIGQLTHPSLPDEIEQVHVSFIMIDTQWTKFKSDQCR
jgi:hypothetical protein